LVAKAAPALKLTGADPVTARCRRVKSAHEIELIRLANEITLKAFDAALAPAPPAALAPAGSPGCASPAPASTAEYRHTPGGLNDWSLSFPQRTSLFGSLTLECL